jgi:hypothetical protein
MPKAVVCRLVQMMHGDLGFQRTWITSKFLARIP